MHTLAPYTKLECRGARHAVCRGWTVSQGSVSCCIDKGSVGTSHRKVLLLWTSLFHAAACCVKRNHGGGTRPRCTIPYMYIRRVFAVSNCAVFCGVLCSVVFGVLVMLKMVASHQCTTLHLPVCMVCISPAVYT